MSQRQTLSRSFAISASLLIGALSTLGCTSNQPTIPNPFNTADRVPPPVLQAPAPGAAQPYYQGGAQPAPAFQPVTPGQPAPTFQQQPVTVPGQPLSSTSQPRSTTVAARGDSISIPSDQSALRFAAPNLPNSAPAKANMVASNRQPATANAWVSGAAPIRTRPMQLSSSTFSTQPITRVPSTGSLNREPVSVAALNNQPTTGQPSIRPLEPNGSDETVGWR